MYNRLGRDTAGAHRRRSALDYGMQR